VRLMEVYFADVGQGTCNVILIGKRRALVIDTGRRAADLRLLLSHLNVDYLTLLAVSHLDADHVGGAPAILTEFRGRIGKVCYPNDHRVLATPFWDKLQSELDEEHIARDQLVRLECEKNPKLVWCSAVLQADLKLFSPTFGENQVAIGKEDANATSGVLVLKIGTRRVVFPGDSSFGQWQEIRKRRGSALDCEIVAIPHHAGIIWPGHWTGAALQTQLEWLYRDAIRPGHAIISVGTSNVDRHPRPEVISTLRKLGVTVVCTQITTQCCTSLESLRPGLLPLAMPGRSTAAKAVTTSGNSRDLACAGTVVADVTPSSATIRRLSQHQAAVTTLAGSGKGNPLCR
jgi:competence protein ComEC